MRCVVLAITFSLAVSSFSQTYQSNSLVVDSSSTYTGAATTPMNSTQENRAAFLPVRLTSGTDSRIGNPVYERITYLAIFQPKSTETEDIDDCFLSSLPPTMAVTSGNCDSPPFMCSGWNLGSYQISESSTYSSARAVFDSLDSRVKPHAYGPLATPRLTYIVVSPALEFFAQIP